MRRHPTKCGSIDPLLLLLLAGCAAAPRADYSNLELINVTGQVTLDGIALSGARIEFESPDTTRSTATTDARGRYRLMFDSEKSGCLPGTKIVRIRMPPAPAEIEDPDAAPASSVVIPDRYNVASQLKANVSAHHRTFDFALTSIEEESSAMAVGGGR
jgi:hypothetical protein